VVGGIQESVTLAAYRLYALKKLRKKRNKPKYTPLNFKLVLNMVIYGKQAFPRGKHRLSTVS